MENLSEGSILVGPCIQMTEGVEVTKDLKGTEKMILFPGTYLAMIVLEALMLSQGLLLEGKSIPTSWLMDSSLLKADLVDSELAESS